MATNTRTPQEILQRISDVADDDFFGFRVEVLVEALPYEHAKAWLDDSVTAVEWAAAAAETHTAETYYQFALGKIRDHRGISAGRSVDKLSEYAWLLGCDDVVAAMGAAEYEQYGAPKVKAFALAMELTWPADNLALERMAAGLPCVDGCENGCGL